MPEPLTPENTINLLRGMSSETFLRLCSRAPRTEIGRLEDGSAEPFGLTGWAATSGSLFFEERGFGAVLAFFGVVPGKIRCFSLKKEGALQREPFKSDFSGEGFSSVESRSCNYLSLLQA